MSPDSERMSTVFVYKLQPNGPAKLAGLNDGVFVCTCVLTCTLVCAITLDTIMVNSIQ